MQLKFHNRNTIRSSLAKKMLTIIILCLIFTFAIFLLEKVNFPHPNKDIKKDITNEITKLK